MGRKVNYAGDFPARPTFLKRRAASRHGDYSIRGIAGSLRPDMLTAMFYPVSNPVVNPPTARRLCGFAILWVAALAVGVPRSNALVSDARQDFSVAANPNGLWSYGTLSAVTGGAFSPFATAESNRDYTGEEVWDNGGSYPDRSAVFVNNSGENIIISANNTVLAPTNLLDLDGENSIAVTRWTAPADGVYNVAGFFQRDDNQSNSPSGPVAVTVSVVQDGTTVLFQQASFSDFQSQATFDLPALALTAGTTLDFMESPEVPHNDTVGLSATITSADVPAGPVVGVSATVPKTAVGSGTPALFTLTRSGDVSQKIVVHYTVGGSGRAGVDYEALRGKATFKPGKASVNVAVTSIDEADPAAKRVVKLVLLPGSGFNLSDETHAKVKIVGVE